MLDSMVTPIQETAQVVSALAEGNLTQTVEGDFKGEFAALGDAVNTSMSNLLRMVGNIREAATAVNTGSSELTQGNNDLSQRTQEQAASLSVRLSMRSSAPEAALPGRCGVAHRPHRTHHHDPKTDGGPDYHESAHHSTSTLTGAFGRPSSARPAPWMTAARGCPSILAAGPVDVNKYQY